VLFSSLCRGLSLVVAIVPDWRLYCLVFLLVLYPFLLHQADHQWDSLHLPVLWLYSYHGSNLLFIYWHSGILRVLFLCEENLQYRQSRLTLFHHRRTFCGTEKKHSHKKFPLLREHKFGLIVNFPYWYLYEVIFST